MSKFIVRQTVLCEVIVTHHIYAESHTGVLKQISDIDSPTSIGLLNGMDYEIVSDNQILKTVVEKCDDTKRIKD